MAEYLAAFLNPSWQWVAYLAVAAVQCGILFAVMLTGATVFTWLERKVSGRIQDRLGPTRVGGRFGWLQSPADGIKLLMKEDLVPKDADAFLFRLAPYISFCASFSVYFALPFANGWVAQQLNTAAFLILALAGLEVFGVILGGYASASKWALFGAMREAAQVISYEIPFGMCVVIPVLVAGTMDLVTIGNMQAGWATNWFLFHDPFTFVTFWIYITCATASVNRAPFDLAEAESELVAGFLTEYSGFRWSVFFMAEYGSMTAVSGMGAILFLGGWNGPIPVAQLLHLTPDHGLVLAWIGNLLGATNFVVKAFLGVTVMMWLRWTLPRIRIDQVMSMCLKYCIPLTAMMLVGAVLWAHAFPGGLFLPTPVLGEFQEAQQASEPKSAATESGRLAPARSETNAGAAVAVLPVGTSTRGGK